jgi:DNA-binding response OmpR family regulator
MEDSATDRQFLTDMLAKSGYNVSTAERGGSSSRSSRRRTWC